ncbi:4Fe-4S cluster-binding domain-containing protein [Peribacillus frigoritolerans]|uniref:radical SAM protein n=1 Tax=Peribacillus frigoritolerans TaxID=450367 RepID=UPI002E1A2C17|nr:radical SAM protein [Peribacillus frigoritolerans]MED3997954.1 4Fe-4S cluster-binding domain-containing protein [Peribacillus frigoritolerans]
MKRLKYTEVESIRSTPGRSLLLFITDRCPVGCEHCSVDSRPNSATIRDSELFESIVEGICYDEKLSMVGISGGEPFVERKGLTLAVNRLVSAGKDIVLYTSGVWARSIIPQWIRDVLALVNCVFLSTDAFHNKTVNDDQFVLAARTLAEEGVWIIVQVLNIPEMVARAEELLCRAFGKDYRELAEINLVPPLPYGRGKEIFNLGTNREGDEFGPCKSLAAPVVRYDGTISACCNEQVIMGLGPNRLRKRCSSGSDLKKALKDISEDPLFNVMNELGVGTLTYHPKFSELAHQQFPSICKLCWAIQQDALPLGDRSDRLLTSISMIRRNTVNE